MLAKPIVVNPKSVFEGWLKYEKTPVFRIDLDTPPAQRWKPIIKQYKEKIKNLAEYFNRIQAKKTKYEFLRKASSNAALLVSNAYVPLDDIDLIEELRGIASMTEQYGLDFNSLLLLNVGYAFSCFCTSAVFEKMHDDTDELGPFHCRNLDWENDMFRDLVIEVDFYQKEQPLFRMTTWVGFVGCLTGMKYHLPQQNQTGFSVSMNFRNSEDNWGFFKNIYFSIGKSSWPVEFLMRHALQVSNSFADACQVIRSVPCIAPTFIIIAGVNKGEGVIITRSRETDDHHYVLEKAPSYLCVCETPVPPAKPQKTIIEPMNYLLQTNIDQFDAKAKDFFHSNERKKRGDAYFETMSWDGYHDVAASEVPPVPLIQNEMPYNNVDDYINKYQFIKTAFEFMSVYPLQNDETMYQVIMRPAQNLYISRVCADKMKKKKK